MAVLQKSWSTAGLATSFNSSFASLRWASWPLTWSSSLKTWVWLSAPWQTAMHLSSQSTTSGSFWSSSFLCVGSAKLDALDMLLWWLMSLSSLAWSVCSTLPQVRFTNMVPDQISLWSTAIHLLLWLVQLCFPLKVSVHGNTIKLDSLTTNTSLLP